MLVLVFKETCQYDWWKMMTLLHQVGYLANRKRQFRYIKIQTH